MGYDSPMQDEEQTTQRITDVSVSEEQGEGVSASEGMAPCLVILSGCDRGRSIRLDKPRNSFGRGQDADIVLIDPKLSRLHGAILIDGERIELVDLKSTNGTLLDGEPVRRAQIGPNARICAGDIVMKVEFKYPDEVDVEQSLYEAANTDPLTGALNRRGFMTRAEQEVLHALRHGKHLSVLLCDIDHFKRINDNYGHPVGDQVLQQMTEVLLGHVRYDDLLARFGGEEFIILLRNTDEEAAVTWADRIRTTVERKSFSVDGQTIPVSISVGVKSELVLDEALLERMIPAADAALYRAKRDGRNRVVVARDDGQ